VIVEANIDTVVDLQQRGRSAIFGDAARSHILDRAGVRRATHLIITFSEGAERTAVIAAARGLNPGIRVLARARYLSEQSDLDQARVAAAVFDEGASAAELAQLVLAETRPVDRDRGA
jgi:CPA2 family monovalent cation:H+ antiporter-2